MFFLCFYDLVIYSVRDCQFSFFCVLYHWFHSLISQLFLYLLSWSLWYFFFSNSSTKYKLEKNISDLRTNYSSFFFRMLCQCSYLDSPHFFFWCIFFEYFVIFHFPVSKNVLVIGIRDHLRFSSMFVDCIKSSCLQRQKRW